MHRLKGIFHRLRGLFRSRALESEMSDELRAHLDSLIERNLAVGMSPDEARFAALRAFGDVAQIAERARDERRSLSVEQLWQDLRYALRQARKHPGFAVVVVLILGLGTGANTAVFSALEVLLLRPLPVREPEQLMLLHHIRLQGSTPRASDHLSFPVYEQIRDQAQSFAGVAALSASGYGRTFMPNDSEGGAGGVRVRASDVSGNYFSVLQVAPALGRLLTADDDRPNDPRAVAVLSHAFWTRQFGRDRGVLGRTVWIEKVAFEVIGVAAPGFFGVKVGEEIDVWTPLEMLPAVNPRLGASLHKPNWDGLLVFGRLRPDVPRERAAVEVGLLYERQGAALRPEESTTERMRTWGRMELESGARGVASDARTKGAPIAGILLIVALLVQLLTCANIASLSLARLAKRGRELAARVALGAERSRLVRQLATESLLLVFAGTLLGLLLVYWGVLLAQAHGVSVQPGGRVLLFGILISGVTGMIVALVPAWKTSRIDLATALKSQSGNISGAAKPRLQEGLVILQLAVSGCLLAGTGLFVRTLQNLRNVDLGFRTENLLMIGVELPRDYDEKRRLAVSRQLLEAVAALPGVQHATYSSLGLLGGGEGRGSIRVPGYTPRRDENMTAQFVFSGPNYFGTIGIPLTRGRDFTNADVFSSAGVARAVISEAVARRFFGDTDPIGRRFGWGAPEYEIIGVARDTRYRDLRQEAPLMCYVAHTGTLGPMIAFQIRASTETRALAPNLAAVIQRIDPKVRAGAPETVSDKLKRATQQEHVIALGVGTFSGLALLLTMLGVYGLLAYNVAQRTKEIGVRIALGGRPANIIALILKQGLRLATLGWIAGILAAMMMVRFVESRLYGVSSVDPLTFVGSGLLLAFVALLACWLPARRATNVDPMVALRAE